MSDWPQYALKVTHKPIAIWAVWAPTEEQVYTTARVLSMDRAIRLYGARGVDFRAED